MMNPIRVLVADDHLIVREGLKTILSTQPDIELVGLATNGQEAVMQALTLRPDVILMDLIMPHLDGLAAIEQIKRVNATARILVLTSFAHDDQVFTAIKAGALGYLLKDATYDQLLSAIRNVANGQVTLDPVIATKMIRDLERPTDRPLTTDPLSERELDTLRLITRGMTNDEIAAELFVHERTVAKHVGNILSKLHLANRTQAALYALRKGIADLD